MQPSTWGIIGVVSCGILISPLLVQTDEFTLRLDGATSRRPAAATDFAGPYGPQPLRVAQISEQSGIPLDLASHTGPRHAR